MKSKLVLLITLLMSHSAVAFQFDNFQQPYLDMVEETFDKEKAYNTVAFVEQYFRVVGNEGFNKSIYYVADKLEKAGFVNEEQATSGDRLVYRIEKRSLSRKTWEPVAGSLKLASGVEILNFASNRNMIAINSFSTKGSQDFEMVFVGDSKPADFDDYDMEGKVVVGSGSVRMFFQEAVEKRGALGVMVYDIPDFNQPTKHINSISFKGIPLNEEKKSFAILLSTRAYEQLMDALFVDQYGIQVNLETRIYEAEELTLVAELRGSQKPDERFVFSAHVQEPGANDNASGVGVLSEVAASSARLLKAGRIDPERTITYLFGDEIVSTRRYVQEDPERAKGIKWGMSLDMVGEDTEKTGGTFLIEKMPDPGAVWVRGIEKHTEWGGQPLSKDRIKPHYFNDLVISVFEKIGDDRDWEVRFNPFEGGSDHVPFLQGNIPGLLLWHFTDQFYHTDGDRIDKVSKETLHNVGLGALTIALMLTEHQDHLADMVLLNTSTAATIRLQQEMNLSKSNIENGADKDEELEILNTWIDYYSKAFETVMDIEPKDQRAFKKNLEETRSAMITFSNLLRSQLH
ncbi:M28 family peptidase [Roseivirga sp.]|uniref:M28 family peptidase n=1 Tax=Roseivirga sp. TaxID=1964215 RepID=UPI003B5256CA